MIQPTEKHDAISITILSAVVLAVSFMPWAQASDLPFRGTSVYAHFPGIQVSGIITAWNGDLLLMGIVIPNSIVVLVAAVLSVIVWLQASQVWFGPRMLRISLAGYAAFHCIWFIFAVSDWATLGIGSILTEAAFVWMLVVLIRPHRQVRQPTTRPEEQDIQLPEGWPTN